MPDAPVDDGAARHLEGARVPGVRLPTTRGRVLDLAEVAQGRVVLFAYPRTGRPGEPAPEGWDLVPGLRGCTPQSCGYRDLHAGFRALGYDVLGVSAQDTAYQREFAERVHLPFELLSDAGGRLADAMRLPTVDVAGMRLLRRLALVLEGGRVAKSFYPVHPPDRNAAEVLAWLRAR